MSDAVEKSSVELDARKQSVTGNSMDPGLFPFDAFEQTDAGANPPTLSVAQNWVLNGKIRARYAP